MAVRVHNVVAGKMLAFVAILQPPAALFSASLMRQENTL